MPELLPLPHEKTSVTDVALICAGVSVAASLCAALLWSVWEWVVVPITGLKSMTYAQAVWIFISWRLLRSGATTSDVSRLRGANASSIAAASCLLSALLGLLLYLGSKLVAP